MDITSLQKKYHLVLEQKANAEMVSWIQFSDISTSNPLCGKTFDAKCNGTTEPDTFQSLFEDIGCLRDKEGRVTFPSGNRLLPLPFPVYKNIHFQNKTQRCSRLWLMRHQRPWVELIQWKWWPCDRCSRRQTAKRARRDEESAARSQRARRPMQDFKRKSSPSAPSSPPSPWWPNRGTSLGQILNCIVEQGLRNASSIVTYFGSNIFTNWTVQGRWELKLDLEFVASSKLNLKNMYSSSVPLPCSISC